MAAAALSANEVTAITAALSSLSTNGTPEVGLEVGTDQGLPYSAYIRIPESMKRKTIARMIPADFTQYLTTLPPAPVGTTRAVRPRAIKASDTYTSLHNKAAWFECTEYERSEGKAMSRGHVIDALVSEPVTIDMMRDFIAANWDHVNSPPVLDKHRVLVIAVRFWAVVCGLVVEEHNREWVAVENPGNYNNVPDMDAAVREVAGFQQQSLLFAAARAYNWKKTNHATGGSVAAGFVRKVMGDLWSVSGDAKSRDKANVSITDAFYAATHGVSVHAALATFAPDGNGHWARYSTEYGGMLAAEVGPSIALRMGGRDAVAGTAQVSDPIKVFALMLSEQLTPLLANRHQIPALLSAYERVLQNSMEFHVGAKWFYGNHPKATPLVAFNQKDEQWFQLAAELAVVSQKYYPGHTISASPALKTLAGQCVDASIDTQWARLYAERKSAAVDQVLSALRIIQGASAAKAVADITAAEEDTVKSGIAAFNTALTSDLAALQTAIGTHGGSVKQVVEAEALARAAIAHGTAWVPAP